MKKLITTIAIICIASSAHAGFFKKFLNGEYTPSWDKIEKDIHLYVPVGGYLSPQGDGLPIDLFNACMIDEETIGTINDVTIGCAETVEERTPDFNSHIGPIVGESNVYTRSCGEAITGPVEVSVYQPTCLKSGLVTDEQARQDGKGHLWKSVCFVYADDDADKRVFPRTQKIKVWRRVNPLNHIGSRLEQDGDSPHFSKKYTIPDCDDVDNNKVKVPNPVPGKKN